LVSVSYLSFASPVRLLVVGGDSDAPSSLAEYLSVSACAVDTAKTIAKAAVAPIVSLLSMNIPSHQTFRKVKHDIGPGGPD